MNFVVIIAIGLISCVLTEITTELMSTENHAVDDGVTEQTTTIEPPTTLETFGNETTESLQESRDRRCQGGVQVSPYNYNTYFSYIVSIYDYRGTYTCVGTVITPILILTAQHCVTAKYLGTIRAFSRDIGSGGSIHYISKTIVYPYGGMNTNDIALLVLKSRIPNAVTVRLLDPRVRVPNGSTVRALGWGLLRHGYPRILMMVDLRVCPVSRCRWQYQGDQWICTDTNWQTYTCHGDSGGPILYQGYQVGIVSHSAAQQCGSNVPTANVNVKKYLSWIYSYSRSYY